MEELSPITSKKSFFRKLRNSLLWLLATALLFALSLLGLLFIYQDDVKAAVIAELNKHLKSEVHIDPKNIDLTIIKTFPDCSIQFKDMLMLEALPLKHRDTLLFTQQLNLHFNISDLWNKHYSIEKITLQHSVIKLKVLKSGKNNYTFWQENKAGKDTQPDSLQFNLKDVNIEHCRLSYSNASAFIKTSMDIQHLRLSGNFGQQQFDLNSDAKLVIHQLACEKTVYLKNKHFNFSLQLAVNDNHYVFKKTALQLNNLGFQLNGNFNYSDSLQYLNVSFNAPKLDIASVLSLLPEQFKSRIRDYESSGNFYAQGQLAYSGKNNYRLNSRFGVKQGRVTHTPQAITASNINLDGALLLSPEKSELNLENFYLRLNNDELKGSCRLSNFSNPYLKLKAEAKLHLENLQSFFPIDTLTLLKGELAIQSDIEGLVEHLKNQTFSEKVKLNLSATADHLQAQFKNDAQIYGVEHCAILTKNREVEVSDLRLKRGSSDMTLNGKIPGVFNYLVDHTAPLIITGELTSSYLKLEDFMPGKTTSSSSATSALIPANVQFHLNVGIGKFTFGKFTATSISGEIDIRHQKAVISDVTLQTMQGSAEIDAFADNSKNRLDVVLQSHLKNINIQDLFSQMNNFGQATLQDKNLKGSVSADIDFSGTWSNHLECNYKTVRAGCNLLIEHGELIDFRPLNSLSRFISLDDLRHIKFSTLQSNISIDNNTITIPKTAIKNSALNIDFHGTHTFDNAIDYHIQLLISELLAKKRKKQDEEFGPVERDKENTRSAFIRMTGTVDNPVIKYDKQGAKEKIRSDIKEEKQNIRQILKEEFGLFKKDSAVHKTKSDQYFELEKPNSNNAPKKTLELKKKEEEDF